MSYEIKCIPASLIRRGDLIIETERPLARVVHRKDHRDVLVWRDGDEDDPWDVIAQHKRVTVFRPAKSSHDEVERLRRVLREIDDLCNHGNPHRNYMTVRRIARDALASTREEGK